MFSFGHCPNYLRWTINLIIVVPGFWKHFSLWTAFNPFELIYVLQYQVSSQLDSIVERTQDFTDSAYTRSRWISCNILDIFNISHGNNLTSLEAWNLNDWKSFLNYQNAKSGRFHRWEGNVDIKQKMKGNIAQLVKRKLKLMIEKMLL